MKVKVVISFHDAANFALVHKVGDVLDVSDERAQKLIDLKLVTKVDVRKVEPKVETPVVEAAPEEPKVETPKKRRSRR